MQHHSECLRVTMLLFGLSLAAGPAQGKPFTSNKAGHQVVMEGNSRGAAGCVACHGEDGAGLVAAGYPRLAGLSKPYLLGQLRAFRTGTRQSAIMERIASALNEDEMENVVAYYAALQVPDTSQPLDNSELKDLGARLLFVGKWDKGTPACVRCHGQDAQGVPPVFPRLAGQHANYLARELHRWQNGERHNDPVGMMQTVAKSLDDGEIKAVSAYLASIEPASPAAAGSERIGRAVVGQKKDDSANMPTKLLTQPDDGFSQPEENQIPHDKFGEMVLLGKRIFVQTQQYASQYTGNGLDCVNCHLDRGRRMESAPMGAAYIKYPKFRSKNNMVNTIEERIQGCFRYSENGNSPPPLSDEMKGLVSYFYFLSSGLPSGKSLDVAGYPEIDRPPQSYDPQRGAQVFAMNCAICHGVNGEGTRLGERYQFPPLWGMDSFNWGAGMHRINTAAAFIRGNMPLGHPDALTLQEVWDVAAYMNSHERPQDPRYDGELEATRKQYHDHPCYYGTMLHGARLGQLDTPEAAADKAVETP